MKKKSKIVGVVIVALLIVALIYLALSKNTTQKGVDQKNSTLSTKVMNKPVKQTTKASKETKKLLEEAIKNNEEGIKTISVLSTDKTVNGEEGAATTEIKAVAITPGTSAIDISTGQVITETGDVADNSARSGSESAPRQSVVISKDELPSSAIKLDVTSNSFTPNEFTVNRGQAICLGITNVNTSTFSEIFRFDDPSLKGIVMGLAHGQTKDICFNVPSKAGNYTFYSSMFNHRDLGAVGVMIVK